MTDKTSFKTIKEFLYQEGKTFVIPNYQRGYKWAVKEEGKNETAVEKLMDDLITASNDEKQEYFLQGVTVVPNDDRIILIDGQQRTTTLYFLLWCLNPSNINEINLHYDIREESRKFIENLKDANFEYRDYDKEENYQDIYYFKKAIEQIEKKFENNKLNKEDFQDFQNFLLNNVTLLYITIDQDKATKTFTMMNGNKATMLQEELVKAEMLRVVSIPEKQNKEVSTSTDDNLIELKEIITQDWETSALRSRYAREWDKWLYWWNKEEVKDFFGVGNPMGLLLKYYYWGKKEEKSPKKEESFSFDSFRVRLIDNGSNRKQKTKLVFKELRDLQKSFEDIFNIPKVHNYLKMSLLCSSGKDIFEIIEYFIQSKKNVDELEDYAKWRLVGATHLEITNAEESTSNEILKSRSFSAFDQLSGEFVYQNSYDLSMKQLLRLNVEEDNKLFQGKGRKFDFSIYGTKSLEHIHPKSKVYHTEIKSEEGKDKIVYKDVNDEIIEGTEPTGKEWLNRDQMENCNEHSIGNLVLLDKNENSKFSDKPFSAKKEIYFNVEEVFKSRQLLHTISVFSKSQWSIEDIQENQKAFIERFEKDYQVELKRDNNEND